MVAARSCNVGGVADFLVGLAERRFAERRFGAMEHNVSCTKLLNKQEQQLLDTNAELRNGLREPRPLNHQFATYYY